MQDYKKLAEQQLALGKPTAIVKKSLGLYLLAQDKIDYSNSLREEYEALGYWQENVIQELVVEDEVVIQEEITEPKLIEGMPTLEEYRNETKVITEAVEQELDEDGLVVVEAVEEVLERLREFKAKVDYNPEIDMYLSGKYVEQRVSKYPSIGEQLDMIYKDVDAWKELITSIKASHPKV